MKFEDAIYTYLTANAALTALVGTKIYPADRVPQSVEPPYVAHYIEYRNKIYTHQGFCGASTYSIHVTTLAKTKDDVSVITLALVAAMEAWRAANPANIGYVLQQDENDGWDEAKGLFFYDLEFDVFYRED